MRKSMEILRLHFMNPGLSNRKIGRTLKISKNTVKTCLIRFQAAGLSWPLPEGMGESELCSKLYASSTVADDSAPMPDWERVLKEVIRPHMTLQLLWDEYRQTYPDGLGRSQFYHHYSCRTGYRPITGCSGILNVFLVVWCRTIISPP